MPDLVVARATTLLTVQNSVRKSLILLSVCPGWGKHPVTFRRFGPAAVTVAEVFSRI